jgi:hypothetical protein
MSIAQFISIPELRAYVSYNPETGNLLRRDKHRGKQVDGFRKSTRIMLDHKSLSRAKVSWAVYYGEWAPSRIFHYNGNIKDFRLVNLTLVKPQKKEK